jgi:hypothetical protein
MDDARTYATKLAKLPDRIAAILAKTYAVIGDEAFKTGISEDVANVMILDLINDLDSTLIKRNANKRLARSRRSD